MKKTSEKRSILSGKTVKDVILNTLSVRCRLKFYGKTSQEGDGRPRPRTDGN
jgi:hypothetical protein